MGATLSPEKILKQVADLWVKDVAEGGAGAAGSLRACSMTLVVVAAPDDNPAELSETLAALIPRHPARTIVIRTAADEPLAARVTAHCWKPSGQKHQVCSEEIQITAAENALDDAFSIVWPIAAADLPLILWCRNRVLLEDPSFGRYVKLAARTIVDSAQLGDPKRALQTIAGLAASGLPIGDLSWTRLTRWREMLSQVFENRQHMARLPEIDHVVISYGGKLVPARAYYMAAWVLDALKAAGIQAKLDFDAHPEGPEDQLIGVDLSGGDFRVNFVRQQETLVVSIDHLTQCTNLSLPTDHILMNEELEIVGRDPVFERVLAAAAQL